LKLDKKERQKNVLGAFEVNKKHRNMIKNKDILLVDDVSTSCATLRECAKILKRNGAKKVYGVTFAREL
jgi:predicted amidophosphoribosyltransferase